MIKQFVEALDKDGQCFKYLRNVFHKKLDVKLGEGIFDGPEIRTLFRDENFNKTMHDVEEAAWSSFKEVSTKFLGKTKDVNYINIVKRMVRNFEKLGSLMNLKHHFLDSVHVVHFNVRGRIDCIFNTETIAEAVLPGLILDTLVSQGNLLL